MKPINQTNLTQRLYENNFDIVKTSKTLVNIAAKGEQILYWATVLAEKKI